MDNAIGLGIILSLRDKASAGLEAIRNKMTALRDVSQEMVKRFDEGAKQMVAGFASMATGGKILGLLEKTFGSSVATAADFEQAMARVGAVSGATGEDFEALSQQARDLGRDTQFSATQAANSQELLARAGFQTTEIISAMPGLLNMAAAEGMDLANAADIAASALRGFGMDASEMNRVADVLAKTSAASNTSIALLGESLKYVAPYAKAVGVDIEQTNAMLGIMANAGIKGTIAGNALKSAFSRLSEEPKRVAKALAELGVKAKTSTGDLRPFPELMKDLSEKMKGMGKADKVGMFNKIFGSAAGGGMLAIMDAVANGELPELEAALYGASGAAQAMADRMNATAQGAMKRLESASEGLRIVIGNHLLPVYTKAIDGMAVLKSWLTQLIEAHPVISKTVIGFTTALLGLSGTAFILVGALASIGGLIKMWPLLRIMAGVALSSIRVQAHTALASLSGLRVPIVGLVALAGLLFYAWRKNLWGIRDMVTAVAEGFKMAWSASVDGIADVDDALMQKLKAAGIWDYAVIMGQVFFRIRQFWNGLVEGFKEGIDFLMGAFDWLKGIFAPVIESGQELLTFLGILKPATETQVSTWKAWGKLFGRLAPAIIAVIAAFKGIRIVKGILGDVGKAILLMFKVITAHPIGALIAGLVALGIYLYTHWDEVSAFFAKTWAKIKGWGTAAADWVRKKWQGFMDWWNSWTMDDVFTAIYDWFAEKVDKVRKKWNDFSAWWDSLTFADIFAPIYDFAISVCEKVKQPFIDFKNWLLGIFANLNPFNWQLPAWLGGKGPLPSPQTLQAQQTAIQTSPQGRNASSVADRYAKAYSVKKADNNAQGGFITHRTLSWVGEEGPEAIIPLTKQSRGVALWLEVGRELGILDGGESVMKNPPSVSGTAWNVLNVWPQTANEPRERAVPVPFSAGNPQSVYTYGYSPVSNMQRNSQLSRNSVRNNSLTSNLTTSAPVSNILRAAWELFSIPYIGPAAEASREASVLNSRNIITNTASSIMNRLTVNKARETPVQSNVNVLNAENAPTIGDRILREFVSNTYNEKRDSDTFLSEVATKKLKFNERIRELLPVPISKNVEETSTRTTLLNNSARINSIASPSTMSIYPHAMGGIFSTPHIGLVAEAGREAIIPLEDRARGIPLLFAAMSELTGGVPQNILQSSGDNQSYSSQLLIQHSQNMNASYEQVAAQTVSQTPEKPSAANGKINVNAEIKPADIYIDGEKVGSIMFRWFERQNIRNGMS